MYRFVWSAASVLASSALSVCSANTLCVSQPQQTSCFTTIGSAVAAAAPKDTVNVYRGTYHEDVIIGKPLSLVAQGRVYIDGTGLANGVYVDGRDNPGLSGVVVSGFTIQSAKFEGILVTNATDITIENNAVLNNNTALNIKAAQCPGIPAFETNEDDDCGEGIHLLGADHSIVADNLVQGNSGGILVSDDTIATHDNLIENNTVQDNVFDCGITLASHGSGGVYHNTVYANLSQRNGTQVPGAGAGVGLFAPVPPTNTWANVVVGNTLLNNGMPGVAMHTHAPGAVLRDNMIAGNTISGNAADVFDTPTPGPAGINISGGSASSALPGMVIAKNVITGEQADVVTNTDTIVYVHLNNLRTIDNINNGSVDATMNWWGCSSGPLAGCGSISGPNILTTPALLIPIITSLP